MDGNNSRLANSRFVKYYMSDRITWFEWFIAALTGALVFITVAYVDVRSLTVWSCNVWDVTLDSNIFHLWEYSFENVHHAPSRWFGSELMSVLPWSIWNIPIWVAQRFFHIEIADSPLSLAWSKLFLVFCGAVMLWFTYKIIMLITDNSKTSLWGVYLTASSTFLYIGVCYAGQNDIIMITASVIAIYYLLKRKRGMFLLWSALTLSVKPFFILAFIAVIMLTEKNVLRIIGNVIIGLSGLIAQKLIFSNAPMYKENIEHGPTKKMLEAMFSPSFTIAVGGISFFAIALVLIYFYAYTRKLSPGKDEYHNKLYYKYVIYITLLAYCSYSFLIRIDGFYRYILVVPFIYIMMMSNPCHIKYSVIIDTAVNLAVPVYFVLDNRGFGRITYHIKSSVLQRICGFGIDTTSASYESLHQAVKAHFATLPAVKPMFSSIVFIGIILLLVLNHPEKEIKLSHEVRSVPRVLIWLRTLILVPFMLAMIYLFVTATTRIY